MAVVASVPFAIGYFLALGLPVALVAYLAYLSRPHPHDPASASGIRPAAWWPALALYGGALPVLVLPLIGGSYESLAARHGRVLAAASRARRPRARPDGRSATSRSRRWPSSFVCCLPGALAAYWLASSRSTSISPAASRAPPAGSGATGRTCRRWPIRRAFRCSLALRAGCLASRRDARRRRHQLHRRPAVRLSARRASRSCTSSPGARALDPLARLRRPLLVRPLRGVALIVWRACSSRPSSSKQPLRRRSPPST